MMYDMMHDVKYDMIYYVMHDVMYDISSTLSWMCFESSVVNKSYTLEPRRDYCDDDYDDDYDSDNDWYDDDDNNNDYDSVDRNSYDYDDDRIGDDENDGDDDDNDADDDHDEYDTIQSSAVLQRHLSSVSTSLQPFDIILLYSTQMIATPQDSVVIRRGKKQQQ